MERNDRNYDREFRNKLHEDDYRRGDSRNHNRQFENYRDRYADRGNYYGMPNEGYEYRNVSSSQTRDRNSDRWNDDNPNRGYNSGSSYGNRRQRSEDDYHYGDPNPHMNYSRNEGYESERGTGWRSERDAGRGRGDYSGYGFGGQNQDRYNRQDNSYQYSGSGRRYNEFGQDENKKFVPFNRSSHGHTNEERHNERSEFQRSREDNNFGRSQDRSNPVYDGTYDDSDFRYSGSIVSSSEKNRSDQPYKSDRDNRSYRNTGDEERYSSRERRHPRSGPDYSAGSSISGYGYDNFGI